jgi:hypothetical protein
MVTCVFGRMYGYGTLDLSQIRFRCPIASLRGMKLVYLDMPLRAI